MKITVITVCRNAAATIGRTIESVLAQDYPDIEYIIVDGMSTDGTMDIVARYRDRIARIIHEPDSGIYDAMNKGIRASTGDFITFANADDYYVDGTVVSKAIRCILDCPGKDIYGGDCLIQNGLRLRLARQPAKISRLRLFLGNLKCQQQMFFRRDLFIDRIGVYDCRYRIAADYEWNLRAFLVAKATYQKLQFPICVFTAGGSADTQLSDRYLESKALRKRYYSAGERLWMFPVKCIYEVCRQLHAREFKLPDSVLFHMCSRQTDQQHRTPPC